MDAAVLAKMHEAGIPGKSTKAGGMLVKALIPAYFEDWRRDTLDFSPTDSRHRRAKLERKIVLGVLFERKANGITGLVPPKRNRWAKLLRDALICQAAQDANMDAAELAEAYLKSAYPGYCRSHGTEKEYRFLHSRARAHA